MGTWKHLLLSRQRQLLVDGVVGEAGDVAVADARVPSPFARPLMVLDPINQLSLRLPPEAGVAEVQALSQAQAMHPGPRLRRSFV